MMDYTKQLREALNFAEKTAKDMRHPYIGTEHLLLGLRKVYTGVAAQVLAAHGVDEDSIHKVITGLVSSHGETAGRTDPQMSPRLQFILEESEAEAAFMQSEEVGTEHVLLTFIKETDSVAARILMTLEANLQKMYAEIIDIVGVNPRDYREDAGGDYPGSRKDKSLLLQYGTDLTAMAAEGLLDPVIGREPEIRRVMQILSRRTKNNPCLLGEPGVGKTAVVEGLAMQVASGMVPEMMKGKQIFTIDLAAMVAGSKYRGEFEERIKKLIREVQHDKNIILFIDEVHMMIGAGSAEGTMDASNIMKPSLARGEIQLIGATTIGEYRKHIEKDAALERRFQPVTVEEPAKELCVKILKGIRSRYEDHHRVTISDEAITEAVSLSERYINDRFLPDKAIDVLDEACARKAMGDFRIPEKLYDMEKEMAQYDEDIELAIVNGDVKEASRLRKHKEKLEKDIERYRARESRKSGKKGMVIERDDIAEAVSAWTKIPLKRLQEAEGMKLRSLESTLHKRVIGQEEAVLAVARAIRRGRVGLKDPKRPIGSFLFLGPTGVGKTELSKALSEALFGDEDSMIRVDMSEYMEKHSVSKMIGSPPGYVGHEEGGQLSEKVRRHPYSVILFDEIEKAHPDVFNILLQVLDDGHITDSQGRKVDFKNTVIIMTSNAGAKAIVDSKKLGFNAKEDRAADYHSMKSNVMQEVKRMFRPEFINRIDETIVFHPLTDEQMDKIAGMICRDVSKRALTQMGIKLNIRPGVRRFIVEKGKDQKYGARPLKRAVQNYLEDPLAEEILKGNVHEKSEVLVTMEKKVIVFKKQQ